MHTHFCAMQLALAVPALLSAARHLVQRLGPNQLQAVASWHRPHLLCGPAPSPQPGGPGRAKFSLHLCWRRRLARADKPEPELEPEPEMNARSDRADPADLEPFVTSAAAVCDIVCFEHKHAER